MSIADKITRLQTAKSGIASAITAKGGTVGASDGFEEFASDIASIPSGGGGFNPLLYAYDCANLFRSARIPNNSHLVFGANAKNFNSCFLYCNCDNLTVEFLAKPTNLYNGFRDCSIKNLTIIGDLSEVTDFAMLFYAYTKIEKILGDPINMSSGSGRVYSFYNGYDNALVHVLFAPNTIPSSTSITSTALDDETIVSIANGLNESKTGQTITLAANVKNKLSTMLGTVAMDSTNTYHVFTLSTSGTENLQNFIASTKGWTIA